ncbi:MAG: acetylornithine/succinylornithine family transaminase [Gammaproteobacteria bacterium]|nr:acetylornithine/succinylornithine family transaminase [Gammaproteobacteria bacterium]
MTPPESPRLEDRFGFEVYPKRNVSIVNGRGALLWDAAGHEYIDCAAGVGVASVGHGNRAVADAIALQSRKLITCPGIFYNDIRGRLMAKLVSLSPRGLNRVFLCNSGTEAMEAALKFARLTTGKHGFVSAMRGFHGRTLGALSATFRLRDEFEPLVPGHRFVPFNNLKKMEEAVDRDTAAVILEIVQGEGGVRPAEVSYLKQVRRFCGDNGILLIIDEVQTGFARTGKMFACEHADVSPDMITLAKAIAGGVPMGAVLCADQIGPAAGKHGSTFGGNPLACAAALATIDYIEAHDLAGESRRKGRLFRDLLEQPRPAPVREIRQVGLMIGIELKSRAKPVIEALAEKGVLALPAGPTVVRLLPPLVITRKQIRKAARIIRETICESCPVGAGS